MNLFDPHLHWFDHFIFRYYFIEWLGFEEILYLNVHVVLALVVSNTALKFRIGECPVYYEEPWDPNMVRFVLSMRIGSGRLLYQINPFQTVLPYGYNIMVPLKIVVHGYGGLTVDTATTNVTAAYQAVGYNVIIGKVSTDYYFILYIIIR